MPRRWKNIKGPCSEVIWKWFFLKLADMVTFPTYFPSKVKKLQICISFVNNLRKQCFDVIYCFVNSINHIFKLSRGLFTDFPKLNYTDFVNAISQISFFLFVCLLSFLNMTELLGTKSLLSLKKVVKLWIRKSTFNLKM